MRYIKKRDCKLSVSDGSVNVLSTCKKSLTTAYAKMARAAVPKLFWAFPKPAFGEHASNNDPIPKQRIKK